MMTLSKRLSTLAVASAFCAPAAVFATNGMNLEGYGPIALGMGGASIAYDNGNAAVMNNPATLGLMADGASRLDAAVGSLDPSIETTVPVASLGTGTPAASSAGPFYMPAAGWSKRQGDMTYGVGMFAQGGMGTEYSANSDLALGSGDKVMSQIGVMRVIVPLSYHIDNKLTVGGSIDYVRASMDLKMAVLTTQLSGMVTNASPLWGGALPGLAALKWGRFDFADGSDYQGRATGDGYGYKLGAVYEVNPGLTVGLTYHSKTEISDLEGDASLSAGLAGSPAAAIFNGKIAVRDFQWPSTYGIGVAYKPTEAWMVVGDLKRINWSETMKDFKMTFTDPGLGALDVSMPQNWDDQTVIQVGAAYAQNAELTWRFGANFAENPIPDNTVNPLFPAVIEKHYTAGVGYNISKAHAVNFALSYAPEVSVTNSTTGITTTHSQTSWQMMYSAGF